MSTTTICGAPLNSSAGVCQIAADRCSVDFHRAARPVTVPEGNRVAGTSRRPVPAGGTPTATIDGVGESEGRPAVFVTVDGISHVLASYLGDPWSFVGTVEIAEALRERPAAIRELVNAAGGPA